MFMPNDASSGSEVRYVQPGRALRCWGVQQQDGAWNFRTVKMAAAALGMYFVRFLRRAFCSLIAICFWIFTRSCCTQACASQTLMGGSLSITIVSTSVSKLFSCSACLQAALLQRMLGSLHHLLNVISCTQQRICWSCLTASAHSSL
jgi:hypothetical protein